MPWLSLLTVWIVWSSTYLGMATAMETITPSTMTTGRFLLAAPILLAMGIPAWRAGARLVGLGITVGGPGGPVLAVMFIVSRRDAARDTPDRFRRGPPRP